LKQIAWAPLQSIFPLSALQGAAAIGAKKQTKGTKTKFLRKITEH